MTVCSTGAADTNSPICTEHDTVLDTVSRHLQCCNAVNLNLQEGLSTGVSCGWHSAARTQQQILCHVSNMLRCPQHATTCLFCLCGSTHSDSPMSRHNLPVASEQCKLCQVRSRTCWGRRLLLNAVRFLPWLILMLYPLRRAHSLWASATVGCPNLFVLLGTDHVCRQRLVTIEPQ